MKSYLASHSASDLKDVAVVKKLTSIPQKPPPGCSISKERIPSNPSVISFFKDKTFGPFPVDARKPYELRGEWVDTLPKRGKDRIVILIHGGAYVLGSPQMYRWMSFAIAKQANARVLGMYLCVPFTLNTLNAH